MSGDPRNDPKSQELLSAQPGVVQELASSFRGVAMTAQATADGLHAAKDQASWTGAAANSFRNALGTFPVSLGKVTSSYQEAADALDTYEGELATLKFNYQNIVDQLNNADTALTNAQSNLSTATQNLASAAVKGYSNPLTAPPLAGAVPTSSPLRAAVSSAGTAVTNVENEIASLCARGNSLLAEFESSRGAAQGKVAGASHVPPQPSSGSILGNVANFMVGMAKGIVHDVTGTWKALENFFNHPSLANLGTLATDVSVDAGIVALLVAAPEATGLVEAAVAEGGTAGEGMLANLMRTYLTPSAIAKEAALLNAGTEAAQGKVVAGAIDVAAAEFPGVGKLSGADAAAEQAGLRAAAMTKYNSLVASGMKPVEALQQVTYDEQHYVLSNSPLTHPETSGPAADAAQQAAGRAGQVKAVATLGEPVYDKVVKDPLKEGAKNVLDPNGDKQPAPAAG